MTERTPDAGRTMGDREMLELAAKAAGIPVYESTDGTIQNRPILAFAVGGGTGSTMPYETQWDPRIDDAQAFRLKVKLHFIVGSYATYSSVSGTYTAEGFEIPDETTVWNHETNGDPFAAERLAITRAAAEVGRVMRDAMHTASTDQHKKGGV